MGYWSPRIAPRYFSLVGGEPTLHPELPGVVEVAASHWTDSIVQLVSNGWFLRRHSDLPATLEKHNVHLEISIHHDGPEYRAKIAEIRALIDEWKQSYSFKVNWRTSYGKWWRVFRGEGQTLAPYTDNNPQLSWQNCPCRWCPQILHGRLYKCPPIAYLPMLDERFGLGREWHPYLQYQPLPADCSEEDLTVFLTRKSEAVCGMCPAHPEPLALASPIPGRLPILTN